MVVASVLMLPPLLTVLVLVVTDSKLSVGILLFQIIFPLVLCILLVKGYSTARAYIVFSLYLGALLLFISGLLSGNLLAYVLSILLGGFYVTAGTVLWRSSAVNAYFDHETHERDGLLSLKNHDGV